jgi:hypothetical protein
MPVLGLMNATLEAVGVTGPGHGVAAFADTTSIPRRLPGSKNTVRPITVARTTANRALKVNPVTFFK